SVASCVPKLEETKLAFVENGSATSADQSPEDGSSDSEEIPANPEGGSSGSLPFKAVSYAQFHGVIKNRCFSCHSKDDVGNFAILKENDWQLSPYLVKGDANNSKIYNYIRGADASVGPKNMPKYSNSPLPKAELEIVKNYINGLSQNEAVS